MSAIRYIGNYDINSEGKFLWEILCQLRKFGAGRIVTKNEWTRKWPEQPSYVKVLRVHPTMDRWLFGGKVWGEYVFRGQSLGIYEFSEDLNRSDWRLIHRHDEEQFKTCKQSMKVINVPNSFPLPPLQKYMSKKAAERTGAQFSEDSERASLSLCVDPEFSHVSKFIQQTPINNTGSSVYNEVDPQALLDLYGKELPFKVESWNVGPAKFSNSFSATDMKVKEQDAKMTIITCKASEPPSAEEKCQIRELRTRLQDVMKTGIPEDLDTDLNILRWIRGYQGDIEKILLHFPRYVSSRIAAGFTGSNLPERYFEMDSIKPFLPYIASSRLADSQWSEEQNAFLFVERAWGQPKEFIKTFKTSDYLVHCFGYSELLLQLILAREKRQSCDKGPVQFIVVFDLATVNMTDYMNPMSGYMKLWQLRSDLWQDWYPEMVQRIFLVNPPRLISLLWKIARLFLSEQNLKRIEIAGSNGELVKHLPKWFLPKEFGGDFVANRPHGDESGVSIRKKITTADYYQQYKNYKEKSAERPKPNKKDIGPGESFVIPIKVGAGKSLLWDFMVSGEVDFFIYRNKLESDLVYPRMHLVTNKLSEEGTVDCTEEAELSLVFVNTSGYFTLKLEYCILVA